MKFPILFITSAFILIGLEPSWAARSEAKKPSSFNLNKDVDTLGGNEDLMEKAQRLRSYTKSRIVQDRIVDRRQKLEFGVSYGGNTGGDSYLKTNGLGFVANYHFTPRWSLGVHYTDYSNALTPEGKRVFDQFRKTYAAGGIPAQAVDVDYPLNATMAVVNWYPVYGKTSFLDMGVTQFDLYLIAGAGQMELSSGPTPIYSAGVGVGAWLSRHISLRGEVKYQTYKDQPVTGDRTLNTVFANVGMGWIL